jgi:hypothetical protein
MTGDGYTTPIACEFIADAKAWEVDSGPHYCGFKPCDRKFKPEHKACECGMKYRHDCTPSGCSHPDNSRPEPEVCATCGHGEHRTCDCRQYDDDNIESDPCIDDQHDRDAGRTCHACNNDLELNADWQCVRCGAHN